MIYRHELKYYIHKFDVETLKNELSLIMDSDPNQSKEGYKVSSLYFDTIYNRFYDENDAGTSVRNKIRIRTYNQEFKNFKLEIKSKKDSLCHKESEDVNLTTVNKLMNLPYDIELIEDEKGVLSKVLLANKMYCLKPVVVVNYNRFALIHKTGNVRITFDSNIKGDMNIDNFLVETKTGVNIISDDYAILEVKYDDILPNYIANTLDKYNLNQIAFSKYYLCRKAIGV